MAADPIKKKYELSRAVFRQEWSEVIKMFKEEPDIQSTKISKSKDNALHLAITLNASEDVVAKLIAEIKKRNSTEAAREIFRAKNKEGDTSLHCAAFLGSPSICQRLIDFDKELVCEPNEEGETPLFLAAFNGHKRTFLYLHSVFSSNKNATNMSCCVPWRRTNGDTILHCTIQREYFDLAYYILDIYRNDDDDNINIASSENIEGFTPLQVLASTPSAFRSGTRLTWWQILLYKLSCFSTNDIELEQLMKSDTQKPVLVDIENSDSSKVKDDDYSSVIHQIQTRDPIRNIREKHLWGTKILEELLQRNSEYKYKETLQIAPDPGNLQDPNQQGISRLSSEKMKEKKSSTALLVATKYGVIELVKRILEELPVAIYDKTVPDKRNVVHMAVRRRQTHVLALYMEHPLWFRLREAVDVDGNNVLHLAAFLPKRMPWEIRGSAMQMQYEAKWFEHVKKNVPPYLFDQENNEGDTPEEIFVERHKELLKESNEWVKDASSSYSIVAALTAGVTYATSYTVPGGNDERTGKPVLEGKLALNIFVVSILVSFCFSITSLAAFLAVFSSRKQASDYRRNLPLKMCLGLTSFYFSVVSIMVSFCAAHSLEVDPRIERHVSPVYLLILLPICIYTLAQIPLHWDLLRASLTNVPQIRYVGKT